MKAVMSTVPPDLLAWRKHTGADRFDEMWEGVLHMVPTPNFDHQQLQWSLETWLRTHWLPRSRGVVCHEINVARPGRWPKDYRVPDLVLITPERFSINKNEYMEGGPDVVAEIRSPGDESFEKIPFYIEIGVKEVWIIDRDTKACEIHVARDGKPEKGEPDPDGWWRSAATGVELRPGEPGKIVLRLDGDDATAEELPAG